MATTERERITLTYTGRRRTTKNTTVHEYIGEDGTSRLFSKRLYPASVGGQITIEADDVHVYPGSVQYLGRVAPEDPRLIQWAALDEDADQRSKAKAMARKASAEEPLEDLLHSLTAATRNLNRAERRALASRLMEALWL